MSARIKAFLIHLAGSIILAAGAMALVFLVWYPAPLAQAIGVTHIFLLMLCIDVIVGPLFTLLVYKVGKKTLKFDLTTIVILQILVFSYGMYIVAEGRPAWLAFNTTSFVLVRVSDIDTQEQSKTLPEYLHAPWFGPKWVAVHMPENLQEYNDLLFKSVHTGVDPAVYNNLYIPLLNKTTTIQKIAKPLSRLPDYNSPEVIKATLSKYPMANSWLPLWSQTQSMVVLLGKNGEIISVVDLHPWKQ